MIQYIISKTKDGTKWTECIYTRNEKELNKLCKHYLSDEDVLTVKVDRVTREEVFRLNKDSNKDE